MKLFYYAEAINEIIEAANYLNTKRVDGGRKFDAAFDRGIQQILERPESWPKVYKDVRQYRLAKYRYGIMYRVDKDAIRVIAVANLYRRPLYWIDRLDQ